MAKRFTDTELYDRGWFRRLPPRLKCAWEWLNKKCDIIGVWNIDMEKLSFEVGEEVTLEDLKSNFKVQVFDEDKLFIPGFVAFQYGDEEGRLSLKNKFHQNIAKKLKARGFSEPKWKPLDDTHQTPIRQGVDTHPTGVGGTQGKGKGKGKGNKGECEGKIIPEHEVHLHYDIQALVDLYPQQRGKGYGKTVLRQMLARGTPYERIRLGIQNFADHVKGDRPKFIEGLKKFLEGGEWEVWANAPPKQNKTNWRTG